MQDYGISRQIVYSRNRQAKRKEDTYFMGKNHGKWQYGAATHPGTIKKENQDRVIIKEGKVWKGVPLLLAAVADGMGGHAAGSMASETAATMLGQWWDQELTGIMKRKNMLEQTEIQLRELFAGINHNLVAYGQENNVQTGTTLSLLFLYGQRFLVLHVGDSRIYRICRHSTSKRCGRMDFKGQQLSDGTEPLDFSGTGHSGLERLGQITEDQSWVALQVNNGLMTAEEARVHPRRNILLHCLGIDSGLNIFSVSGMTSPGDAFLLCSDGYHALFTSQEILQDFDYFIADNGDFQHISRELVEKAVQRGATDNVSVIIVQPGHAETSNLAHFLRRFNW